MSYDKKSDDRAIIARLFGYELVDDFMKTDDFSLEFVYGAVQKLDIGDGRGVEGLVVVRLYDLGGSVDKDGILAIGSHVAFSIA